MLGDNNLRIPYQYSCTGLAMQPKGDGLLAYEPEWRVVHRIAQPRAAQGAKKGKDDIRLFFWRNECHLLVGCRRLSRAGKRLLAYYSTNVLVREWGGFWMAEESTTAELTINRTCPFLLIHITISILHPIKT